MNYSYYDAMLYSGKPETGMPKITVFYKSALWPARTTDFTHPDVSAIEARMQTANINQPVCLNIEHWDPVADIEKYRLVIRTAKAARPELQVGFYKTLPKRDYWAAVNKITDPAYIKWAEANKKLELLGDEVDLIFPSLYTFYAMPVEWKRYAIENIHQARRYGKPVIPFICPQYHVSVKSLARQWLPADFWLTQLDICARYADSVAFWGEKDEGFSDFTGWWTASQTIINSGVS